VRHEFGESKIVFQIFTKKFPSAELLSEQNQTMMFSINDVKVDFTELDPDSSTDITWNEIKKKLTIAVKQYTKKQI